jgi:hypothetical protein
MPLPNSTTLLTSGAMYRRPLVSSLTRARAEIAQNDAAVGI